MVSNFSRNLAAIRSGAHTPCPGGCVPAVPCRTCHTPRVCAGCGWCYACCAHTQPGNPAAVWAAAPATGGRWYWLRSGPAWHVYRTATGALVATVWPHTPGVWAAMASNGVAALGRNPVAAIRRTAPHTPAGAPATRSTVPRCGCMYCTGCHGCGLLPGQTPQCATRCNPTAVCPVCHTANTCTGCGQCYNPTCGTCANCRPCPTCPQCQNTGNPTTTAACHPCWGANHNGTHPHNGAPQPTPTHTTVCMVCPATATWPYPASSPASPAQKAWWATHQH